MQVCSQAGGPLIMRAVVEPGLQLCIFAGVEVYSFRVCRRAGVQLKRSQGEHVLKFESLCRCSGMYLSRCTLYI